MTKSGLSEDSFPNSTRRFGVWADPLQLALAATGQFLFPMPGKKWVFAHGKQLLAMHDRQKWHLERKAGSTWEYRGREERIITGNKRSRERGKWERNMKLEESDEER